MSDNIPTELIREILSRLSAPTLLQCKLVCKAWRDMIGDPRFIRSHLDRQLLNPDCGLLVFEDRGAFNSYCSVPIGSLITHANPEENIKATPFDHHPNLNKIWTDLVEEGEGRPTSPLLSSCNGVMFLYRVLENTLSSVLWNPTTGESRELPPHTCTITSEELDIDMRAGFGYDYTHDDYKAVITTTVYDSNHCAFGSKLMVESELMVYSLKSDSSWRRIKDFPYSTCGRHGIFLNGALHWIGNTVPRADCLIVAIDLGSEDYFEMQMPLKAITARRSTGGNFLNVLDGCISLLTFHSQKEATYDVWVMKDYRVESSWTKLYSITDEILRPIFYSKSKGLVVLENLYHRLPGLGQYDCRIPEYAYFDLHNKSSPKKLAMVDVAASVSARSTFLLETLVQLNTTDGRTSRKRKIDEEETSP